MDNGTAGIPEIVLNCEDILIHSTSPEQHLTRLEVLFTALTEFGIKLEPEKCKLMYREISKLGYHLSEYGMTTEQDKLEKIRKEIFTAIGLFYFFRLFVKNFSKYSLVLSALTRKHQHAKVICYQNQPKKHLMI